MTVPALTPPGGAVKLIVSMLIRYRNGLLAEAVILSLTGSKMRVALKDADDVLELRLIKDMWVTEDGEPVTFDFTLSILAAAGIAPPADTAEARHKPAVSSVLSLDFSCPSGRAN
jgi:hypothetical protein